MKSIAVNFVVCCDLGFRERAAVDAQGMVFADRAVCNRVDVKHRRGWHLGALPARAAQTVFVEEDIVSHLVGNVCDDVAVCGAGRGIGSVRNYIGNVTKLLGDKHSAFVVGHQRDVLREACSCCICDPKETRSGERFDEADDFYGELTA